MVFIFPLFHTTFSMKKFTALVNEWQAESRHLPAVPEVWPDRLIAAGQAGRQTRSLRYQLASARFPIHRDPPGFDWAGTPLQQA